MKPKQQRAKVDQKIIQELAIRAGGRCEFHGCNKNLLSDILTKNKSNLSNVAHIVAAKEDGTRGNDLLPIEERNNIDNLMLVCLDHHHIIDDKKLEVKFPKELLQQFKKNHEERIATLTGINLDMETVIVRMRGKIRGNSVAVSATDVSHTVFRNAARYPFYLNGESQIEIDMSSLIESSNEQYWNAGIALIDDVINTQIVPGIEKKRIQHISVFALARISFLAYFGYALGDKVPVDLYQKHRDEKEGWCWNETVPAITFFAEQISTGTSTVKVAVLLSISGKISIEQLPKLIDKEFTVFEIMPHDAAPDRTLIQSRDSLNNFRVCYQSLLRKIEKECRGIAEVHLFAAVPAPAAIICGRELLRGVSPAIVTYEKQETEYIQSIKIKTNDTK